MKIRMLLMVLGAFFVKNGNAQDSIILKVHFLYGSKPAKEYYGVERKWLGGIHGGHVGIEIDSNRIFSFLPKERIYLFPKDSDYNSRFVFQNYRGFYQVLGGEMDSNKRIIFYIPITHSQYDKFDSICLDYQNRTPYDYAVFGMRCASATYDILSQLGLLEIGPIRSVVYKVFYPKKLRKIMYIKAIQNNWFYEKQDGTSRRVWEKD